MVPDLLDAADKYGIQLSAVGGTAGISSVRFARRKETYRNLPDSVPDTFIFHIDSPNLSFDTEGVQIFRSVTIKFYTSNFFSASFFKVLTIYMPIFTVPADNFTAAVSYRRSHDRFLQYRSCPFRCTDKKRQNCRQNPRFGV